jgi:hypothetical protein
MAESWRAKANRYARGDFTNRELKILLGGMLADQVIDVATYGQLSRLKGNMVKRMIKPLLTRGGAAAVSALPRVASTALRGAKFVTMRHPYIAAAVVTYEVVKNRDQIAQLAREGWEVIDPYARGAYEIAEEAGVYDRPPGVSAPFRERFGTKMPRRRKSKFNRAMSNAMKAVKASSKGGKKGTLSNPKATFRTVSKAVSKVNKGLKVGTTGISGIAARAARKVIGKNKKPKKGKATFAYRKN